MCFFVFSAGIDGQLFMFYFNIFNKRPPVSSLGSRAGEGTVKRKGSSPSPPAHPPFGPLNPQWWGGGTGRSGLCTPPPPSLYLWMPPFNIPVPLNTLGPQRFPSRGRTGEGRQEKGGPLSLVRLRGQARPEDTARGPSCGVCGEASPSAPRPRLG